MGSGASIATSPMGQSGLVLTDIDFNTYKCLENAYLIESSRLQQLNIDRDRPESIRDMLLVLQTAYDECCKSKRSDNATSSLMKMEDQRLAHELTSNDSIGSNQVMSGVVVTLNHSNSDSNSNSSDRLQRNKDFLIACGAFHKGKARDNIAKAQSLYFEGVDLDYSDSDGCTALHHACGEGHTKIVEWLLELDDMNEKIINSKANDSCTPLWTAAFNGRRDAVMLLLLFGADESIKGAPEGEPTTSPALAARRNRQPGLADAIDLEASLRAADPERRLRQLAKGMDRDEFKESIRSRLVAKEGPA